MALQTTMPGGRHLLFHMPMPFNEITRVLTIYMRWLVLELGGVVVVWISHALSLLRGFRKSFCSSFGWAGNDLLLFFFGTAT